MTAFQTIAVADLEALSDAVLARAGLAPDDRAAVTRVLVGAEIMGIATHGVTRLESYVERTLREGVAVPTRLLETLRGLAA